MIDLPVNPKTGKYDGIYYTFGSSECCVVLAHILMTKTPDKFRKVSKHLFKFTEGLKALSKIPYDRQLGLRKTFCQDWLAKYIATFNTALTVEEGRTFVLNVVRARYREIVVRQSNGNPEI